MPKLRLDGDASGAIKAVVDLHKAQDDLVKGGKETEKQFQKLGGSLSAAARKAQTDWQKYNSELQKLALLVKKGTIDQKTADQAAQRYYQTIFKGAIAAKQAAKDELAARHAATRAAQQEAEQKKILIAAAIRFHSIAKSERAVLEARKRTLDQIRNSITLVDTSTAKLNRTQGTTFGATAVDRLATYAAGYIGIQKAIQLATSEIEAYKRIEESRTQAQLTAAQGEASLRENIAFTVSPEDQQRMLSESKRLASSRSLAVGPIYEAMGRAFGALGNPDLAIKATEAAAKLTRNLSQIGDLAGGIGDVMTTAGIKSPDEALGFLGIVAGYSRVESPGQVAKQAGKVAAAFESPLAGSSAAQGGALFAAATQAGADPMGEATRTGVIQLINKSEAFFEKNAAEFKLQKEQFDDFDERNALLMGNQGYAKKFFKDTKFEATVRGALESLYLVPEGDARKAYEGAFADLQNKETRIAAAERAYDFVGQGRLQATSKTSGAIQSMWESFSTSTDANLALEDQKTLIDAVTQFTGLPRGLVRASAFTHAGFSINPEEAIAFVESSLNDPHATTATTGDKAIARDELKEMVEILKGIKANQEKRPAVLGRERVK
jgi:hypothetical protein